MPQPRNRTLPYDLTSFKCDVLQAMIDGTIAVDEFCKVIGKNLYRGGWFDGQDIRRINEEKWMILVKMYGYDDVVVICEGEGLPKWW